ncbi:amidohydrolase family protein [Arvimicrobium flavum]|uniref:amidohydrolase family protein n=1 Tax=Arvimicrobium flavum TaxID=3393320 RepID=UPI00237C3CA6|nr:amidohydrolase family protein [Mesorhizobium shangrilense]
MTIIDAHLHLFPNGYTGFQRPSPLGQEVDLDVYERLMAAHGISGGLVVCYEGDGIDPTNNAYVRDLAGTRRWIESVAYVDPSSALLPGHIEALLAAGHVGVALYLPDASTVKAALAWPRETWDRLSIARAIVSLNARPEAIAALPPLIERAEGCAFLFSHLGLPGRCEARPALAKAAVRLDPLLRLAPCGNVGVKISGLYAIDPVAPHRAAQPFVELLLERFSPSDLHWGSDFSPALEFVNFEETMQFPGSDVLSDSQRRLIFGEGLAAKIREVRR